ncbi:hypothetical protein Poly41_61270 [Novipirellula artificiosorum]|uniref:Uncharacterized protein n=1 Tax=Novipirellula artificiosorum TaxID=2528016 RepID=A0A5C6D447_9BACT|nr:hypothetical protein Poly41_61270 [Novipirellula artificiosorum]
MRRTTATRGGGVLRILFLSVCVVTASGQLLGGNPASGAEANADSGVSSNIHRQLETFRWSFGRESDANFDDWPDGWRRSRGHRHPQYVGIAIAAHDPAFEQQCQNLDSAVMRVWPKLRKQFSGLPVLPPSIADFLVDRYLRVDLDGGLAMVQSAKVNTSGLYQYRFTARVTTQGLRHDHARVEFVFYDASGKEIESHATEPVRGTTAWTKLVVNNVQPPPAATEMCVRLIVDGAEDGLEDIRGSIGFDDLQIEPFPQLQLVTNEPLGIYPYGRTATATAIVLGLPTGASRVHFRLFDVDGNEIKSQLASIEPNAASSEHDEAGRTTAPPTTKLDMQVSWDLPRLPPGFYQIAASLEGQNLSSLATETTLAVIEPLPGDTSPGCFGWTLPTGDRLPRGGSHRDINTSEIQTPRNDYHERISPRELVTWLTQLGVDWVKYPCWVAPDDNQQANRVAEIFTRFQDNEIQTVGMLDQPREDQVPLYDLRSRREVVASQLFRDAKIWQPLLEPVMTRLTLKVRKWQLGSDQDFSFLGRSHLRDSINNISIGLQGYGQPLEVAICWPWSEPPLPESETSWQAVCRSGSPELTADELDAALELHQHQQSQSDGPDTWVLLDPISKTRYDRDDRVLDLVLRMATVRKHRVEAAFVSNPHDEDHGLLNHESRPDVLLLPWRTTAQLIGNLRQVGSLRLRCDAPNIVFAAANRAVLMVWSNQPQEEILYLGENVQAIDVWGKTEKLPVETYENRQVHRIKIGKLPLFLVGVDPDLLAFRMSVDIAQTQVDSLLGQIQPIDVTFANPSRDGLAGTMRIRGPEAWSFEQPSIEWELLGGSTTNQQVEVVLGNNAKVGKYELALDFELQTVPPKRLTVYRNVTVGPTGLELKSTTRILDGGQLRVEMEMINHSDATQSYDCMLFPQAGRQYQRRFITIEPGQTTRRDFYWPDGAQLLGGTMLLIAREQDGRRILNYEIPVHQ